LPGLSGYDHAVNVPGTACGTAVSAVVGAFTTRWAGETHWTAIPSPQTQQILGAMHGSQEAMDGLVRIMSAAGVAG
jgi:hypothetical protein